MAVEHTSDEALPRLDPISVDLEILDIAVGEDRRRAPRTPVRFLVGLFPPNHDGIACCALDLSRNGVRIQPLDGGRVPLDVGALVNLRFQLPNSSDIIRIRAELATSSEEKGLGFYFLDIDGAQAEAIEEFALYNGWML